MRREMRESKSYRNIPECNHCRARSWSVCVWTWKSGSNFDHDQKKKGVYTYSMLQSACVCKTEKLISKYIFFKPEIDEVVVFLIYGVIEHSQMTRVHSLPSFDVKQIN